MFKISDWIARAEGVALPAIKHVAREVSRTLGGVVHGFHNGPVWVIRQNTGQQYFTVSENDSQGVVEFVEFVKMGNLNRGQVRAIAHRN